MSQHLAGQLARIQKSLAEKVAQAKYLGERLIEIGSALAQDDWGMTSPDQAKVSLAHELEEINVAMAVGFQGGVLGNLLDEICALRRQEIALGRKPASRQIPARSPGRKEPMLSRAVGRRAGQRKSA